MAKVAIEGASRKNVFHIHPRGDKGYVVQIVGLDTAHKEGEHPLWDERIGEPDEALAKLAANIRAYGVFSAVKVRKNGKTPDGRDILEVVAGRRRTRACRLAYDQAVAAGEEPPLLKVELERRPEEDHLGVMISENEQRRNDGPAVRAKKIGRLLSLGHTVASVARMFGVTEQSIETAVRFNELALPVRQAVDLGQVAYTAALEFHGQSQKQQTAALERLLSHPAASSNGTGTRKRVTAKAAKKVAREENGEPEKLRITPKIAAKLLRDEEFRGALEREHETECVRVIFALLELVGGGAGSYSVDLIDGLEDAIRRAEV